MLTVVKAAKSGEAVAYYTSASGRRAASPDDPALAEYWAQRRRKAKPPLDNYTLRLLARQDALRGPPAHRRSAAAVPERQGTMVATGHPSGDSRGLPRPPREIWPTAQWSHPPRARLLPPRASPPPTPGTSTVNLHALAACLSRMPRRVARTMPTTPSRSITDHAAARSPNPRCLVREGITVVPSTARSISAAVPRYRCSTIRGAPAHPRRGRQVVVRLPADLLADHGRHPFR